MPCSPIDEEESFSANETLPSVIDDAVPPVPLAGNDVVCAAVFPSGNTTDDAAVDPPLRRRSPRFAAANIQEVDSDSDDEVDAPPLTRSRSTALISFRKGPKVGYTSRQAAKANVILFYWRSFLAGRVPPPHRRSLQPYPRPARMPAAAVIARRNAFHRFVTSVAEQRASAAASKSTPPGVPRHPTYRFHPDTACHNGSGYFTPGAMATREDYSNHRAFVINSIIQHYHSNGRDLLRGVLADGIQPTVVILCSGQGGVAAMLPDFGYGVHLYVQDYQKGAVIKFGSANFSVANVLDTGVGLAAADKPGVITILTHPLCDSYSPLAGRATSCLLYTSPSPRDY